MLKVTPKIRRRSITELYVRSKQAVSALAEQYGWSSLLRFPADRAVDAIFETFQSRTKPKFFPSFIDRGATVSEIRARWASTELNLIARADSIVNNRFHLLGLPINFREAIDWHLEPISNKRVPVIHWAKLDYLSSALAGDKKFIWELNRHQYFVTLGQAYWLTGDERYAKTFVKHLDSWMEQNPPKLGINWASSLELAFRSISWLWGLYFFKDSSALAPSTFLRVLKFLYLHARHLETYLSTYFSPNTHLTGEALGLFYLGTLLPEFHEAERWRNTGRQILLEQLPRHVKPDGVYFEQSSYYHRYTTDFYIHFLILARLNDEPLPPVVEETLQRLLDHLMYVTRPDGSTPFFGDDDGGRLLMLDQRATNDFRATLSTGAALFGRGDYKFVAKDVAEETLWLLGPEVIQSFALLEPKEPDKLSVGFEYGGYYVMRDSWTPTANYLLFDCGPHGTANCGHAHADALAFELVVQGKSLFVDPGTYTYTGSKEFRDWFRSSPAHNTLTVDNRSSSMPNGPFSWKTTARCQLVTWINKSRFDFVSGTHDGYSDLPAPVLHVRSILFLKHDYWVIVDRIVSSGNHKIDLWFHPERGVEASIENNNSIQLGAVDSNRPAMQLLTFASDGAWRREEGWLSSCYGEKMSAPISVFSSMLDGSGELVTFMLPVGQQKRMPEVREIEALGGRAFELLGSDFVDRVMVARTSDLLRRIETAQMVSDFDCLWARFAPAGDRVPQEIVAIDGQTVELGGDKLFSSNKKLQYCVATSTGRNFRVDTDKGIIECRLPLSDLESINMNPDHQSTAEPSGA